MDYLKAFDKLTAEHLIFGFEPDNLPNAESLYKDWAANHPNHIVIIDLLLSAGIKMHIEYKGGVEVKNETFSLETGKWLPTK